MTAHRITTPLSLLLIPPLLTPAHLLTSPLPSAAPLSHINSA